MLMLLHVALLLLYDLLIEILVLSVPYSLGFLLPTEECLLQIMSFLRFGMWHVKTILKL